MTPPEIVVESKKEEARAARALRKAERTLLHVSHVADRLNVSTVTIRNWIREGRIKAKRMPGRRGMYRIHRDEMKRLEADVDTCEI